MRRQSGFTLIEMIIAMVITGIIASMVAVFIATPVQGYIDSVRRAGLTDVADLAFKRLNLDVRTAVPNSVRLRSTSTASVLTCAAATGANCYLEYIPARSGGRYCADTDRCPSGASGALSFSSINDTFDVLGPAHDVADTEFLVIYNTAQSGLNAYAGDNIRKVGGHAASSITVSGNAFPYASPSNRFQVVAASGPASLACESIGTSNGNGTGSLNLYNSYASWPTTFTATQPMPSSGGTLLADNLSACSFTYDTVSMAVGLVTISLTITRNDESVTLFQQIHVDNLP